MRIAGPILIALFALTGTAAAAPGDPWVAYVANATAARAVVMRVDPATGGIVEVSRNGAQGQLFNHPYDIAVAADGSLLVADMGAYADGPDPAADGAIVRVDPATGSQSLVSRGGRLVDPAGLALAADGTIVVVDNVGLDGEPELLRIDAASGAQTVLSVGDKLCYPFGVALERSGSILVTDFGSPPGQSGTCPANLGQVLRVNPGTGAQSTLAVGGTLLRNPFGIAVAPDGGVLVVNQTGGAAAVMSVHPVSGHQQVVTGNGPADAFVVPQRIALSPDGEPIVSDFELNDHEGGLVRVQVPGGAQSILRQGELFNNPLGVAVVTNRPPLAALSVAPPTVRGGVPVSFDASGSSDPEGLALRYAWDLDGNGSFETDGGASPTASRSYESTTTLTARVRVTDPHGGSATAGAPVGVDAIRPVISAFAASPRRLRRGTTFTYRLSEPAGMAIALRRRKRGRWRTAVTLHATGFAGANKLRFRGRGGRGRIAPGAYRALALATDAVGNVSAPRKLALSVLWKRR
jgi:sugar lactone lactonase YvrE